ncbi:MAG: YqgE/AlgH family protein [Cytophagales bacterium]|nr:MAG: YqgE/AlgH family protein [Cytophagales bacterium]TAF62360.1 MAG: YqgE/AlgH family protein [Cytophagales bacterium]
MLDEPLNQNPLVQSGNLLVSEPFMADENFERSVVLLCEHNPSGTFGFILNKPTPLTVSQATDLDLLPYTLYLGGPVEPNMLHYLHCFDDISNALPIRNGLFWGGDFDEICQKASLGILSQDNCRFFMGYSGWASEQLEDEIKENCWIISRAALNDILSVASQTLWAKVLQDMGGKYKVFSHFPTDPRVN